MFAERSAVNPRHFKAFVGLVVFGFIVNTLASQRRERKLQH
jgi:hypothetical protein